MRLSRPQSRLRSLDVFRGVTIASMILVNTPGSREDAYAPLLHADWTGWTFADTIFPSFLWIVGVSLTLSSAARLERGENRAKLFKHAVQRSALLFACGVALSSFHFPVRSFPYFTFEPYFQVTGTLQKIGVCYLAATAIFLCSSWRGVLAWIVGLNVVYLALMCFYPVPECGPNVWTPHCNFAGYLDRVLMNGHMWRNPGVQDPDGLGSVLPAVSSVLFGVLAGHFLRHVNDAKRRALGLLAMACALIPAGLMLATLVPISKPLWTTSYAVLMAGLASAWLALWIWVADVENQTRWLKPFEIFGMNAIAAYIISIAGANVAKVHFFGQTFYEDVCLAIASPANASLIYAALHVLGVFVVVWWMYRRRWFLRI